MNGKHSTHAEVKHSPSKRQMEKEKTKDQLIYAEVKTCTSKSNKTKVTRTELPEEKGSSVPFAWFLAVVILGIFCFFLLLTTVILGFMVLQGQLPKASLDNVTQEDNCTCNMTFKKKPLDRVFQGQLPKASLHNVTQEDNSAFKNMTFKEKPLDRGRESNTRKVHWSCWGQKCYYFSDELKNFEESRKTCKEMGSSLLKIDDVKELFFIQSRLSYFYWIGLSRKGTRRQWRWEDNSLPFIKLDWKESKDENCASIGARRMAASDCSKFNYYICEK